MPWRFLLHPAPRIDIPSTHDHGSFWLSPGAQWGKSVEEILWNGTGTALLCAITPIFIKLFL
jgi:hypothetical protein